MRRAALLLFAASFCQRERTPLAEPVFKSIAISEPGPTWPTGAYRSNEAEFLVTLSVDDGASLTNIALATRAIDGRELAPGETFSFNETVGPRTPDRGYVPAETLFMGAATPDYGGGVCAVATVLFGALRRGGYLVTERHPHSRPRSYVPLGMDAAVNYPDLDLKFQNNRGDRLVIMAALTGYSLSVSLLSDVPPLYSDSRWVPDAPVPPPVTEYRSAFVKKRRVHQHGEPGTPGKRIWLYSDGSELIDRSDYRPLTELVLVPEAP